MFEDRKIRFSVERPDMDKTVGLLARLRILEIAEHVRIGWANYSYLFFIGGVIALLASAFGTWSAIAPVVTVGFFYYAGKFHERVQAMRKKESEKV